MSLVHIKWHSIELDVKMILKCLFSNKVTKSRIKYKHDVKISFGHMNS